ncbi:MAM domain-containing glycosylphosphatidylinositol anchor protein 1 isoform X1, partial [Lates japonicus]
AGRRVGSNGERRKFLFAEPGGVRTALGSRLTLRTVPRRQGYDGTELNMELFWILLFSSVYPLAWGQGVYAPANAQIVHSGAACNVKDDNISERIYTIKEGDTLVLQCIVKGHPRPQNVALCTWCACFHARMLGQNMQVTEKTSGNVDTFYD